VRGLEGRENRESTQSLAQRTGASNHELGVQLREESIRTEILLEKTRDPDGQ
jgi:hypothetical protein